MNSQIDRPQDQHLFNKQQFCTRYGIFVLHFYHLNDVHVNRCSGENKIKTRGSNIYCDQTIYWTRAVPTLIYEH